MTMAKLVGIVIAVLLIAALGAMSASLFMKAGSLDQQLRTSNQMLLKMKEEVNRAETEKEKLAKENEKLQADTVSYLEINTDLQRAKEEAEGQLIAAREDIAGKEGEIRELSQKFKETDKKLAKTKVLDNGKMAGEKKELADKIKSLEETLKRERGLYHYNLAVAYTEAKLYDDAIDAYNKSLEFSPDNPEAYYNLGLLYQNFRGDPIMAAAYYRKYLELKPFAGDRDEVKALIDTLER